MVANKIDITRLEELGAENRAFIDEIISKEDIKFVQMSCHSEEGVMDLKNQACDALLAHLVEHKVNTSKMNSVLNRIHVAQPKSRDDVVRSPFIPEAALSRMLSVKEDAFHVRLEKDLESAAGGPGVYSVDMRSK